MDVTNISHYFYVFFLSTGGPVYLYDQNALLASWHLNLEDIYIGFIQFFLVLRNWETRKYIRCFYEG